MSPAAAVGAGVGQRDAESVLLDLLDQQIDALVRAVDRDFHPARGGPATLRDGQLTGECVRDRVAQAGLVDETRVQNEVRLSGETQRRDRLAFAQRIAELDAVGSLRKARRAVAAYLDSEPRLERGEAIDALELVAPEGFGPAVT